MAIVEDRPEFIAIAKAVEESIEESVLKQQ